MINNYLSRNLRKCNGFIIVLTIGIILLTILKGNDVWKWVKEDVGCCFGKKRGYEEVKEKVEDNFERKDREALEEYNKAAKEFVDGGKKDLSSLKECYDNLDETLQKIELKNTREI